jgi:hypothetical protein
MWIDAIERRISEGYLNKEPTIIVLVLALKDSETNLYNNIKPTEIFPRFFKASINPVRKCI